MTTTSTFRYIDTSTFSGKPWVKIDCPDKSFGEKEYQKPVHNLRGRERDFTTDTSGFQVIHSPAKEKHFTDDATVRGGYYNEVTGLIHRHIKGVKRVHIFDHTIRRRIQSSPRQPIQQVHVDQTAAATIARIRSHLPAAQVDSLLQGRYHILNVWRPIENPASDFPLAVIDWRTTEPKDFIPVSLMYPKRTDSLHDPDDRGKEELPDPSTYGSTEGYELRGDDDSLGVQANEQHKFYYLKDMSPEEVMVLKCYDSFGEGEQPFGLQGVAVRTPHTAFVDPLTPMGVPARQSIEVRCLVFHEQVQAAHL